MDKRASARPATFRLAGNRIEIFGRGVGLPASPLWRIVIGGVLVVCGLLGIVLPILGLWMVPLGLLVLSIDLVFVRRWRRQSVVRWSRWRRGRDGRRGPGIRPAPERSTD